VEVEEACPINSQKSGVQALSPVPINCSGLGYRAQSLTGCLGRGYSAQLQEMHAIACPVEVCGEVVAGINPHHPSPLIVELESYRPPS
jgi:hypothetical protein